MGEPISILVVDDEPLARRGLKRLIEAHDDFVVVGEASDGLEAEELVRSLRPELLLLDVEMPAAGAFELLERLEATASSGASTPLVILVTAFSEFGMDAFDAGAVDYVLKPVDPARLTKALERVRPLVRAARMSEGQTPSGYLTRVVCKIGGRVRIVPTEDIHWIESRGSYVHLHTVDGEHLVRQSLTALEGQLDPGKFARVHRSYLVALGQVQELRPAGHGDALVRLANGQEIPVSRRLRVELAQRLGL